MGNFAESLRGDEKEGVQDHGLVQSHSKPTRSFLYGVRYFRLLVRNNSKE